MSYFQKYIKNVPEKEQKLSAIAYLAAIDSINSECPQVAKSIVDELKSQRNNLKLIASENYCSLPVQLAMGNLLTDKYAEGHCYHRFYAGCENIDAVESLAIEEAKKIFGCDHAYVQPHSGADANLVAFWSIIVQKVQNRELQKLEVKNISELSVEEYERIRQELVNQKMVGMSLTSGGHLTHGFRLNVSSKMMQAVNYDVDPKSGLINYKSLEELVKREKPLILLAGYSAYPRLINFAKMKEIADIVGAVLMVDMAHFAGLVAGKVLQGEYNPVPYADIITSTTHKTLRGPRGGLILCTNEYKETIDKGCPIVLGGPQPHVMAAKAVAFKEANTPSFQKYAEQIVKNAKVFAEHLQSLGASVITKGTDNHLILIDVAKTFGLTGRQAENALRKAQLTVNRNTIPNDQHGPWYTSGLRFGTPAVTTLGMKEDEMKEMAQIVMQLLRNTTAKSSDNRKVALSEIVIEEKILHEAQDRVKNLLRRFPLYPELIID